MSEQYSQQVDLSLSRLYCHLETLLRIQMALTLTLNIFLNICISTQDYVLAKTEKET